MESWERFSDRARRMVLMASDEAGAFGAEEFGPEHLFLAILSEPESTAARVLEYLGLTIAEVEHELRGAMHATGSKTPTSPRPSPALKDALRMAVREAKLAKHEVVGTEHLLLGLVHVGGRDILGLPNLDLSRVREAIEDCGSAFTPDTDPVASVSQASVVMPDLAGAALGGGPHPDRPRNLLAMQIGSPVPAMFARLRKRLTEEVLPRLAVATQEVESLECDDADKHHALLELERTRAAVLEIIAGIVDEDDDARD